MGHEDSSDEEGGWEDGTNGSRGEGDAGPSHELVLRTRTHSSSSASSGEPEGDRGDVTPVPGQCSGPVVRDAWRASVTSLLRHAALMPPLTLMHRLHTVLKEVSSKTISLCESAVSGAGGAELGAVLERLGAEEPPLLWAGPLAIDTQRARDAVRYAALEINEHLETYFDRREHALEALELARPEELSRCVYKLIFQLLLLLETNNKMLMAVYGAAIDNKAVEMSGAVCAVRNHLTASSGDICSEQSPEPHDDARLLQLMQRQKWSVALAIIRERNLERILERGELPEDDITSLLHVYCKGLAQAQPDMVAITRPVHELSQNLSFMMESLYKVSVALQRQDYE